MSARADSAFGFGWRETIVRADGQSRWKKLRGRASESSDVGIKPGGAWRHCPVQCGCTVTALLPTHARNEAQCHGLPTSHPVSSPHKLSTGDLLPLALNIQLGRPSNYVSAVAGTGHAFNIHVHVVPSSTTHHKGPEDIYKSGTRSHRTDCERSAPLTRQPSRLDAPITI